MARRIIRIPATTRSRRLRRRGWAAGMTLSLAVALFAVLGGGRAAAAAEAPPTLGTTSSFGVLAGSTVTNTGPSVIDGDLGLYPGTSITGFPPGLVNGTIHATDAVAQQAQSDLGIAYDDAAGRAPGAAVGELGGSTLVAGVYTGTALSLTGTVTLDAQGDPNAVFIFQSASTLITAASATVALLHDAQACNVFWQVGSSATLGTDTTFTGTILALTSITAQTGTTASGRLLARNGAVTLDDNHITVPTCSTTPTGSATGPTGSATGPTGSATTTTPTSSATASATGPTGSATGPTGSATTSTTSTTTTSSASASATSPSDSTTTTTAAETSPARSATSTSTSPTSSATSPAAVAGTQLPDTGDSGGGPPVNPLTVLLAGGFIAAAAVGLHLRRSRGRN